MTVKQQTIKRILAELRSLNYHFNADGENAVEVSDKLERLGNDKLKAISNKLVEVNELMAEII